MSTESRAERLERLARTHGTGGVAGDDSGDVPTLPPGVEATTFDAPGPRRVASAPAPPPKARRKAHEPPWSADATPQLLTHLADAPGMRNARRMVLVAALYAPWRRPEGTAERASWTCARLDVEDLADVAGCCAMTARKALRWLRRNDWLSVDGEGRWKYGRRLLAAIAHGNEPPAAWQLRTSPRQTTTLPVGAMCAAAHAALNATTSPVRATSTTMLVLTACWVATGDNAHCDRPHDEIAAIAGVHTETARRELQMLERAGLTRQGRVAYNAPSDTHPYRRLPLGNAPAGACAQAARRRPACRHQAAAFERWAQTHARSRPDTPLPPWRHRLSAQAADEAFVRRNLAARVDRPHGSPPPRSAHRPRARAPAAPAPP